MRHATFKETQPAPNKDRIAVVNSLLASTRLTRRRGTPDEAEEAILWEKQLMKRMEELQRELMATAA